MAHLIYTSCITFTVIKLDIGVSAIHIVSFWLLDTR